MCCCSCVLPATSGTSSPPRAFSVAVVVALPLLSSAVPPSSVLPAVSVLAPTSDRGKSVGEGEEKGEEQGKEGKG